MFVSGDVTLSCLKNFFSWKATALFDAITLWITKNSRGFSRQARTFLSHPKMCGYRVKMEEFKNPNSCNNCLYERTGRLQIDVEVRGRGRGKLRICSTRYLERNFRYKYLPLSELPTSAYLQQVHRFIVQISCKACL